MLLFLLAVPLLTSTLFYVFTKTICWKEFLVVTIGVVTINLVGFSLSYAESVHDVELLNGHVTGKHRAEVSCTHSYQCNCVDITSCSNDMDGRETCSTTQICQTCYDHANDYDWNISTNIETITIARVDPQGVVEPTRWTIVKLGEPVAIQHSYTNYIKAAPGSVLLTTNQTELFKTKLPSYPEVYDYYRVNRLLTNGLTIQNHNVLNNALCDVAGLLGSRRQVNLIFVLVAEADQNYAAALKEHWLGGKKNDLVIIIGAPDGDNIKWVYVMSWSPVELLKVKLRDQIIKLGSLNKMDEVIKQTYNTVNKEFVRKPMADFEYLKYQFSPAPWILSLLMALGLLFSVIVSIVFIYHDPFSSGFRRRRGYKN